MNEEQPIAGCPELVYKPPNMDVINANPILKKKYELALKICEGIKVINLNKTTKGRQ